MLLPRVLGNRATVSKVEQKQVPGLFRQDETMVSGRTVRG